MKRPAHPLDIGCHPFGLGCHGFVAGLFLLAKYFVVPFVDGSLDFIAIRFYDSVDMGHDLFVVLSPWMKLLGDVLIEPFIILLLDCVYLLLPSLRGFPGIGGAEIHESPMICEYLLYRAGQDMMDSKLRSDLVR